MSDWQRRMACSVSSWTHRLHKRVKGRMDNCFQVSGQLGSQGYHIAQHHFQHLELKRQRGHLMLPSLCTGWTAVSNRHTCGCGCCNMLWHYAEQLASKGQVLHALGIHHAVLLCLQNSFAVYKEGFIVKVLMICTAAAAAADWQKRR